MRENQNMDEKELDSIVSAGLAGAAQDVVSRYGSAVKEHIVVYTGFDAETGQSMKRSLKGIAESKVNPDYAKQNLKQQAGFAAEEKEVARCRAEERIAGRKPTTMRTDDIPGHVNDELFDITSKVDASGNPVRGASAQMKFVGSSPKAAVQKMLGKDYQKYIDNDCKMLVPSDYYDGMKAELEGRIDSLEKQVKRLKSSGNGDAAARKQAELEKCRKLDRNLRKSKVSNEEAMEARLVPGRSTAKDIARVSHRAGMEQAKIGAAIGGGVSIIRNVVAMVKDGKDTSMAMKDVVCDTAGAAALSYATGAAGAAIKGAMQNAGSGMVRTLSKTNLPAYIVSTTFETGKTLKRYFCGEIDGTECLEELGEKGAGMISSSLFAAIGQAAIPIPVVGALAGSMIGYALSAASYKVLTDSFKAAKLSRERRERIERECAEAVKMIREYRKEMETAIERYFAGERAFFDDTFSRIKNSIEANDVDGYIDAMNAVATRHGGSPQFRNMAEFNDFMASGDALVL